MVAVEAAGDSSKTSREIDALEYHLLNRVDGESTDNTSGRNRYSRLPAASVPPIVISMNAAKWRDSIRNSSETEGRVYSAYGVPARNEAERYGSVDLRN
jgi:hypothetical protein